MSELNTLPIAIIGAGPVGLAAAANLIERGIEPLILEAGPRIAASMWDWRHVRLFTPWSYLIDPASKRLLTAAGDWQAPADDQVPYGKEVVEQYLEPLAGLTALKASLHLGHRVVAIARQGHDRLRDGERDQAPFLIVAETAHGPRRFRAKAVIDASGTWTTPNPMGAGGVPADGEGTQQASIRYGTPDVLGGERSRYAGKRTLIVGSGHSAIGTVLSLLRLAEKEDDTLVTWAIRRRDPRPLWGGGEADEIAGRGALGTRVQQAVQSGAVNLLTGYTIREVRKHPAGIEVVNEAMSEVEIGETNREIADRGGTQQIVVDEIVVAAGSRPDLAMLRELRLELDIPTEASKALGPLIDPNHHSCGSVPPHGADELRHPEKGFFIVGMKSYGRAPTFLLRTGYEQVRSVAAELAGDLAAARRVELNLPQTGVCSTDLAFAATVRRKTSQCCKPKRDSERRGLTDIGCGC